MIEIIKIAEPVKARLLLKCSCGSVVVFDESDIEGPDYREMNWSFRCPVCGMKYVSVEKARLIAKCFETITEKRAEELLKGSF